MFVKSAGEPEPELGLDSHVDSQPKREPLTDEVAVSEEVLKTLCKIVTEKGGRLNPAQISLLYKRIPGSQIEMGYTEMLGCT